MKHSSDFRDEEEANKCYESIKDRPKILSWGDAILRGKNAGHEKNLSNLKETFREDRDNLKKSMQLSYESSHEKDKMEVDQQSAKAQNSEEIKA